MDKSELMNDLKDIIVRVQGTSNVLRKPDIILADRKLQGIRDKLKNLLYKVNNENKNLIDKLQVNDDENSSD